MIRNFFILLWATIQLPQLTLIAADEIDFNRDVRPILSNKCLLCHGPDLDSLEADLRLDVRSSAVESLAIVPGEPAESELISRIESTDDDMRMPPAEHGKKLDQREIDILSKWIEQGAKFATHWSYVKPTKPELPTAKPPYADWPKNAIDHFVLRRMLKNGLKPSKVADRYSLARRVFLDLTGLPPTIEEVDAFVEDQNPKAFENLVDDLLQRPTYGEHWARKWLDLARYADSAGYADDPPRTIWSYRDWVIRAINNNMPFDQFTEEQLAGDLLPDATQTQLIATAFHRNTLTNNEGGTQDEEFRNVAVVDRVNTTMAVWMGTTMACAQCHSHKYDPISQEEYFQFFAIFNNTQDADRRNESPLVEIFTTEQAHQKSELESQVAELKLQIETSTPELVLAQKAWEEEMIASPEWSPLVPERVVRINDEPATILDNGGILIGSPQEKDTYTIDISLGESNDSSASGIAAIRLESLPHETLDDNSGFGGGNFVITGIKAEIIPVEPTTPTAKFIRVTNNGKKQILSLAEVQVFSGNKNVAVNGNATQESTAYSGSPELAIDGNTNGNFEMNSVTHTNTVDDPWWELELESTVPIQKIVIWNRTDNKLFRRLRGFTVELLDEDRQVVGRQEFNRAPNPSIEYSPGNNRNIGLGSAFADYHQPKFEPADVLTGKTGANDGWAIGGRTNEPHQLVLVPTEQLVVERPSILRIYIEQNSPHVNHLLGHFRLSSTADTVAIQRSRLPSKFLAILDTPLGDRSVENSNQLSSYYREKIAPDLKTQRDELDDLRKRLAAIKPATTVPVLRELTENRRKTHLQHRGNYLDTGQLVEAGLPAAFHQISPESTLDRLALARWLTSADNPLTARVVSNRYWETVFGKGIVVTSEEFGSQGALPTHPELLDWLATELIRNGWNTKELVRLLVTSATYQQCSSATLESTALDPDNRWLSRAPRVRLSAEMVRDQALFASGLLSHKMYGPPVKPPQPNLGLTAAFGGSTDWKTSQGEDRYRRGLYTTWRRSNPYPSMATFDAPNREVCTVRRNSTNTPLQSLVTLNDPVYVEAAQSLARIALQHPSLAKEQVSLAFRRCLLRPPSTGELNALSSLLHDTRRELAGKPEDARQLATDPIGKLPDAINELDAAAMTVVCNVLLNLDEIFLKR